jgi:transmembrane 9 superfamily protein 3
MTGLLQTVFFFGYSALACLALGCLTGTIGAVAAGAFVRGIYLSISSKLN